METTEDDMISALQSLFYNLEYNSDSVVTEELTKSFGWDTSDSFMQHDVHELNMVLHAKLKDKLKGTDFENTINKWSEGHYVSYIKCTRGGKCEKNMKRTSHFMVSSRRFQYLVVLCFDPYSVSLVDMLI